MYARRLGEGTTSIAPCLDPASSSIKASQLETGLASAINLPILVTLEYFHFPFQSIPSQPSVLIRNLPNPRKRRCERSARCPSWPTPSHQVHLSFSLSVRSFSQQFLSYLQPLPVEKCSVYVHTSATEAALVLHLCTIHISCQVFLGVPRLLGSVCGQ